jgi:hypothetical protein
VVKKIIYSPQGSRGLILDSIIIFSGWGLIVQLVAKKTGNENFPNVNLILSICQLIVYLTIPVKKFKKMSLNFDHYSISNLSLVRRFHTMTKL